MTNQTEQGAARPRITVELLHRVYRNTPEWAPYLRARFAEPGAMSFELDGHRWAYRCSSFDDAGEYDLLWRPDANPTSEGYTSDAELTAELHLLEEVCAFYANDEDRYLREEGEAYGSIPTPVGMKARAARRRFNERAAATAKDQTP